MGVIGACFWVTTRCGLRCDICYAALNTEPDNTFEGYHRVLQQLKILGARKVAFTGGDPFLVRGFDRILSAGRNLGFKVAVTTNGSQVDAERLLQIEPFVDEMTLPMDGMTDEISWAHRTIRHDHQRVLRLLSLAPTSRIEIDVSTVVTALNIGQLPQIADYLEQRGIRKWKVFQYSALDQQITDSARFSVSKTEFQSAQATLVERTATFLHLREVDFRDNSQRSINSYMNILPGGDIQLSKDDEYFDAGSVFDFTDGVGLLSALRSQGFDIDEHLRRHFRDL